MSDSLIVPVRSILEPLPIGALFPREQPFQVELGAGDGSFLTAYAQAHPKTNFIGVERLLGRLRKIEKKAKRAGLENVRLVRIEADYFTKYLIRPNSVAAVHIYFPDPWPKRRHWKNRLINPEFTQVLRKVLVPGGVVYLRTDDTPYFAQMIESFSGNATFEKIETPKELLAFVTDFERGFHARGVPTQDATYRRIT
jgi:tRNA (guanine-N7-)-methyltransferase